MYIVSNTIDMNKEEHVVVINFEEFNNIIVATFNGQTVGGVINNKLQTFIFKNEFLDCIVTFKNGTDIVLSMGIFKFKVVEFKVWNKRLESVIVPQKLIPTMEGVLYAKENKFAISGEYDRGINDGLILGQML